MEILKKSNERIKLYEDPIKQQWTMKRPKKMERHNLSVDTKTSLSRSRFCLN